MRIIKSLAVLLIFVVVGCLGGYLVASTGQSSSNTRWQRLSDPPEKAVRIVEIGNYGSEAHSITVATADGTQYDCCGPWPADWSRVAYPKERYGPTCEQVTSTLIQELPGKPVDCTFVSQFEWVSEQYLAAVLEDGSVWRWHYRFGLDTLFVGAELGGLIGLATGIIAAIFIYRKPKPQS